MLSPGRRGFGLASSDTNHRVCPVSVIHAVYCREFKWQMYRWGKKKKKKKKFGNVVYVAISAIVKTWGIAYPFVRGNQNLYLVSVLAYEQESVLRYEVNQRMNKHWVVTDIQKIACSCFDCQYEQRNHRTWVGGLLTYICMQLMQFSQKRNGWSLLLISQFHLLYAVPWALTSPSSLSQSVKRPLVLGWHLIQILIGPT